MIRYTHNFNLFKHYLSNLKINYKNKIIYTCCLGRQEIFPTIKEKYNDISYICFVSGNENRKFSSNFQIIKLSLIYINFRYTARIIKLMSHLLFSKSDLCLWFDSRIIIKKRMTVHLFNIPRTKKKDIIFFHHRKRNRFITEILTNLLFFKDSPFKIIKTYFVYSANLYFNQIPLIETGIIVRNNKKKNIKNFNTFWTNQIIKMSVRDQLSVGYSIHKTNPNYVITNNFISDFSNISDREDYSFDQTGNLKKNIISKLIKNIIKKIK